MPGLEIRDAQSYTDGDYERVEAARVGAAIDARVSNADVLRAVNRLQETLDQYGSAIAQVVTVAEEVKVKVDPVLAGLSANPMVKMFLGKAGR